MKTTFKLTICDTTRALACAAALFAFACPTTGIADPTDDILRHFENVAFGSEIDGVSPVGHIQKWMSPIRVSLTEMQGEMTVKPDGGRNLKLSYVKPGKAYVDLVKKHLSLLVGLTGTKTEKPDKSHGKPANFVIKFVPRLVMGQAFIAKDVDPEILKRLARPGVCYFLVRAISTGAMFRSLIVVNKELPPEQMDACLLEEMTQAMGLPNDSDIVSPSIFNQKSTSQSLSDTDVLLLKILYDQRLPAGTPKMDAMRISRDILSELQGK